MANPWDNDPIYKPLAKSSAPAGNPWDNDPIYKPLADQIPAPSAAEQPQRPVTPAAAPNKDGILGRIGGALEVPLSMGTGMVGGVVGNLAGLYAGATSGKFGTQAGVKVAEDRAGEVANALTYQPRTQTGNKLLQTVGEAINDSGIMGVPLPELNLLARAAVPARAAVMDVAASGGAKAVDAGLAGTNKLAAIVKPKEGPALSGVGAAATPEATMRNQLAGSMDVPIKLTKGQAERTFEQQRFERETAKLPEEGKKLRERFAQQNEQVAQNFDAWIDETGAQAPDLRSVGEAVTGAVAAKRAKVKAEIKTAYDQAEQAGHMSEPVDISSILKYVEDNRPASLNAPVLNSVEQGLKKLDPNGTGLVSIKDLEELRKMTGRLSQPGTPNSVYGGDVKSLIDAATEGKGGDLYKQARSMYAGYANEFKNQAAVEKLLRNKPGTIDRAVAYEDVFGHSILKGSADDVAAIRKTLQSAGAAGDQAWRELQGQTVNHIKTEMTKGLVKDEAGNQIISPDKLNKAVTALDKSGKLEIIFGKQGAQKMRDINDLAKDMYVAVPNAVNHSNTASVIAGMMDSMISYGSGLPLPVTTVGRYAIKKVKTNRLLKQVDDALE